MIKKWKRPGSTPGTKYFGLYMSWRGMFRRAGNRDGQHPTYVDVTICNRWHSYDNFFDDMSKSWFPGANLDKDIIQAGNRIYCPECCKWVTKAENNKEKNTRVQSKKVKCIETGIIYNSATEAEEKLGLSKKSVCSVANPKHSQKSIKGLHFEYI